MMTTSTAGADDDGRLIRLINGFQASQATYVAVTLGIPDLVCSRPLSSERLASLTATHPASLYRLLRALAAIGLLHEGPGRAFGLTALGRGLVSGSIDSRNAWARFAARPPLWASWGKLLHSVRTGETAFRHVHGKDVWSFRASHAEESAIFDLAMQSLSASIASDLAATYDFTPFGHIIDVGGGNGALIAGVLTKYQHATGTLLDLPHVTTGAREVLEQAGVRGRCEIVSGSFFDSVPAGGDVYLMKSILHDWDDREALHVLQICRRAMQPGAKLLIIERLLAPPNEGMEGKLSDLNMLVNAGGRERTREEFSALIASAGLELTAITPLSAARFIIEAIPAGEPEGPVGSFRRELDTKDTKSSARDLVGIRIPASLSLLGSVVLQTRRLDVRKALIVSTAITSLALAGVFAFSANTSNQGASTGEAGIDIFGLSQRARNLPEQSYPAH